MYISCWVLYSLSAIWCDIAERAAVTRAQVAKKQIGRGTNAELINAAGSKRLDLVEEQRPVELKTHGVADISDVKDAVVGIYGGVGRGREDGVYSVETGRKAVGRGGGDTHIAEQKHANIGRRVCSCWRSAKHGRA